MEPTDLNQELVLLHAQGDSEGILARVEAASDELAGLPASPIIGSIFRFAMLAEYRRQEYGRGDVWWHRAMQQFAGTGYVRGVAVLLITASFRAADLVPDVNVELRPVMNSVALMTISAVEALACAEASRGDADGEIFEIEDLFGLSGEKHAYCLFRAGSFDEAVTVYERALGYTSAGANDQTERERRRELKISGGRALALYLRGDRDAATAELRAILEASRVGDYLVDIHRITAENLRRIDAGEVSDQDGFVHYDLR